MQEELVLKVDHEKSFLVPEVETDFEILERQHLQEWILKHPQILGDGVRVVTSEFDKWQSAAGDPLRDRLDVLAIDPVGRLVLAELKVGTAPHTVHMQAVNYAAMVSRLSLHDIAELYAEWHGDAKETEIDDVVDDLTTQYLLTDESIRNPRIVLVASHFPTSVTTSVVWLNERNVDISLVRYRPYRVDDGSVIVSFSKLFPVPTVEDFTVGRRQPAIAGAVVDPGPPWDAQSLRLLIGKANAATLALMDLCANAEDEYVKVLDIQAHADLSIGQVRGQLAGFTMLLRNPKYGFAQNVWPITIDWAPGGVAQYTLSHELSVIWKSVRSSESADGVPADGSATSE